MASTTASTPSPSSPSSPQGTPGAPPRRGRRTRAAAPVPLGSLTQQRRPGDGCAACGSPSVTSLSITLTDGTPAGFASCRTCGHRRWHHADGALSIDDVLVRSTKG